MIAGITADSGAGALLVCSTFAGLTVGIGVIVEGWRTKRRHDRHPLVVLGRICGDDR